MIPDVGAVEGDEDGGVVEPLPAGPGVVAGHGVEQGAGHHAHLHQPRVSLVRSITNTAHCAETCSRCVSSPASAPGPQIWLHMTADALAILRHPARSI